MLHFHLHGHLFRRQQYIIAPSINSFVLKKIVVASFGEAFRVNSFAFQEMVTNIKQQTLTTHCIHNK